MTRYHKLTGRLLRIITQANRRILIVHRPGQFDDIVLVHVPSAEYFNAPQHTATDYHFTVGRGKVAAPCDYRYVSHERAAT